MAALKPMHSATSWLEGLRSTGEELLDAQRGGGIVGVNQGDVAEAAGDQLHAAQAEGPHEGIPQFGAGLHHLQDMLAAEFDRL
jgi:hypothetical protein